MLTLTHTTLPSIGELAAQLLGRARGNVRQRGGLHITRLPVHGGSKEAGSYYEEAFFGKLDDTMRRACRRAVKEAFEKGRKALVDARRSRRELTRLESLCARITAGTIRVYEALLRMEWAVVSRSTVHRALEALEEIGLLARLRRYVQTKDKKVGARSEQTSNAYRLELPAILRDLIERRFRPAPMPEDEAQRQHERLADHADMLSKLSKADYLRATHSDPETARALIRLLEGIEKRDGVVA